MAGTIRAVTCLSRNKRGADIVAVLLGQSLGPIRRAKSALSLV